MQSHDSGPSPWSSPGRPNHPQAPMGAPKKKRRFGPLAIIALIIGGLASLLIMAMMGFGILMELGVLPDAVVVTGDELSERPSDVISEAANLRDEETIEYYFGDGLSYREHGVVLTNERIIVYENLSDSGFYDNAELHEIAELETSMQDGIWKYSRIRVIRLDGSWFEFQIATDEGGDDVFVSALEEAIAESHR